MSVRGMLSPRHDAGQALVLIALMLPVLMGFLGLGVDVGRIMAEQRKLQNQADSAALSGGADLSKYYQNACSDAATALAKNATTATSSCSVYQTTYANDTIKVVLSETYPLDFFPLLGVSSKTLSATAVAQAVSITGCSDTTTTICAPYAAWRPGTACTANNDNYSEFEMGQVVIIRSSQSSGWVNGTPGTVGTGAGNCNTVWTVAANDFKGFLRPYGQSYFDVGNNILSKGGNACGQEPVSDIQAAWSSGQTLVIPVLDSGVKGQGNGNPSVHIVNFISISLNFTYPYPGQIQSITINGTPTGGTFKLSFNGAQTGNITYDPSLTPVQNGQAVQTALTNLSTVGGVGGTVTVTYAGIDQSNAPYFTIQFGGALGSQSLPSMTASSSLTGVTTNPPISITLNSTNASKAGSPTAQADYSCPLTWYAQVVPASVTGGSGAGFTQTGQCNSSGIVCRVVLIQ